MSKITYDEYLSLLRDPDTPEETIEYYSVLAKGSSGFDVRLHPNAARVLMTSEDAELENAMSIGNGLARFRRKMRFKRRQLFGSKLPVLVSEGDSWFQFPLLIREVVDQLGDDYLVWSVGAAGDTAQNMVFNSLGKQRTEYMLALRRQKQDVQAFLFSAAGNDVIGEDPDSGDAMLFRLLKDFVPGMSAADLIDDAVATNVFEFLDRAYRRVIQEVRSEPGLEALPILVHGYDYPFPYPFGANDPRNPLWADNNHWLGRPLDARNVTDQNLRRDVIKLLIDRLYAMLDALANDFDNVTVVDCRGAMPSVDDWADEIHGTTEGFAKVASRFKAALATAIP